MAIKFPWRYSQQDLSAGDLLIPGRSDRSYEILDVYITAHTTIDVPSLFVNDKLMLGMPSQTNTHQLFPNKETSVNHRALLSMLRAKHSEVPTIKSTPGDDVRITATGATGIVTVIFRELTGTNVFKGTEPGGPDNEMRLFISHGRHSENMAVGTESFIAEESQNPAGLVDFPFGQTVPSNRTMELIAMSTKVGTAIGANTTYIGIRLWKKQEAFLVDAEGYLDPLQLPYLPANNDNPLVILDKTLMFVNNDEFKIEMQFTNAGGGAELAEAYFTGIFIQRPA